MRGRARTALVRCIGAPRPIRARQLCTGRSPGSRPGDFSPSARLLASMMKTAARLSSSFFERLIHGFGVPPPPIRRTCNGIWARYGRLQLRGQPRIGGGFHRLSHSRFSPFGPPKH